MPVQFERDALIATVRMIGVYSTNDIRDAVVAGLSGGSANPPHGLVFDVTQSESIRSRSAIDVRAMAGFLGAFAPGFSGRLALVACDDVAYGLMRLGAVAAEAEGMTAAVFRRADEARARLLAEARG